MDSPILPPRTFLDKLRGLDRRDWTRLWPVGVPHQVDGEAAVRPGLVRDIAVGEDGHVVADVVEPGEDGGGCGLCERRYRADALLELQATPAVVAAALVALTSPEYSSEQRRRVCDHWATAYFRGVEEGRMVGPLVEVEAPSLVAAGRR